MAVSALERRNAEVTSAIICLHLTPCPIAEICAMGGGTLEDRLTGELEPLAEALLLFQGADDPETYLLPG